MSKNASPQVVIFRLSDILRERNMTQTKCSEITGISRSGISALANGPVAVRLPTLTKLCAGLGVTPADLFSMAPAPANGRRA